MNLDDPFKSKAFLEAQLWVFNGFAAVSLAFYFALLGAGSPDKFPMSLNVATVLFGISLATNSSLSFIILLSGRDPDALDMLNRSKYFGWIPVISTYSTGLAVLFLIAFYSWWAFTFFIITIFSTIYLFYKALSHEKKQNEIEMRKLQVEKTKILLESLESELLKESKQE